MPGSRRDQDAFATLVGRHGPLVWGVCRRALGHTQDAEDAFQATFLVLARKAGTVAWRSEIAGWLHAVALHVTRKAREQAGRRRALEREAAVNPPVPPPHEPDLDLSAALDAEIHRLPEKYRRPIVLCYLEGHSYTEAARLLGWREGTVSGRLARARELLRKRLAQRGLAPALLAALLTGEVASAAPAALVQTTIRASLAFVTGLGAPTSSAVLLAEGVLRTMLITKLRIGAVVVLLLALTGIGVGSVLMPRRNTVTDPDRDPPPARDEAKPPAVPKDWVGRWMVDPFAGAESIEVQHLRQGPGPVRTYILKDPKALATLLKTVKITAVHNDMFIGSIPKAQLTVTRKDGSTFHAGVEGEETLSSMYGIITLKEEFLTTLGKLIGAANEPVDLTVHLPALPDPKAPPFVKPSERSLTAGFRSLTIQYFVGGRLHEARFTDEKTLDALHRSLALVKQAPPPQLNVMPRNSRDLTIVSKDGSIFHGRTLSAEEFYDREAGLFTVRPDFLKAIAKEVSRAEGREIDLFGRNALTEAQGKRAKELYDLLSSATKVRYFPRGREAVVVAETPDEVQKLLAKLQWVEVPVKDPRLPRGEKFVELEKKDGKKLSIPFVRQAEEETSLVARTLLSDLVDVPGFGQVWINSGWKTAVSDTIFLRERERKRLRDEETARLVTRDMPTFYRQVISVVAHYSEGESHLTDNLTGKRARAVMEAVSAGKFERLDWSEERWQKELEKLDERAIGLDLTPGIGFALPVYFTGKREALIPMCGRITFAESPLAKIEKAIKTE